MPENLTGFDDYNALVGWGGQNAGSPSNGYNGTVNSLTDLGRAVAFGAGGVFGGPLAGALAIGNMVVGQNTGQTPSTMNTARAIAQALGLMDAPRGVVGPVMADTGTALGSKDMAVGSSLGERNGGFDGPDIGAQGDATAERRGMAGGGYTGNAPRGAVTGPVHGQEFVFSAPAVEAIGLPTLRRMMAAGDPRYAAFVRAFGPEEGEQINMLLAPRR